MKKILLLLLLVFVSINMAYAKIQVTYLQTQTKMMQFKKYAMLCENGMEFKQGNDQINNVENFIGKNVYIKYFRMLEKDYYVAIRLQNEGPFNLSGVTILNTENDPR